MSESPLLSEADCSAGVSGTKSGISLGKNRSAISPSLKTSLVLSLAYDRAISRESF